MDHPYKEFIFEAYHFDEPSKTLTLSYSLDGKVRFDEQFIFDFPIQMLANRAVLDRAFFGLFVMAGISYFKTYLPTTIRLATGRLCPEQQAFFTKSYTNGLAQFFVENNLDPHGAINFPSTSEPCVHTHEPLAQRGNLVSLGGGKDSLVSIDILEAAGEEFATWSLGSYRFFDQLTATIGREHFAIKRLMAPNLRELSTQGAYNGHIPISALWGFIGLVAALLTGRNQVIVSNESSANEASLEYKGLQVNHQYSKTLEFEQDFQTYIRDFISPDLAYFSLLRPLTELKIAELFCTRLFDRYAGLFSSCNKNFVFANAEAKDFFWCGTCAKCAFIFAIFAPFVPRTELLTLFGKNLFSDPALRATYDELMGRSGYKPFDCVGEIEETKEALWLAWQTKEWPELATFELTDPGYDYNKLSPHSMPGLYATTLESYLKKAGQS